MALAHKILQRIDSGTGLVLNTELLREAGFDPDDEVLVHAEAGRITISKFDPSFDDLVLAADRFVAAHPNAIRKLAQ